MEPRTINKYVENQGRQSVFFKTPPGGFLVLLGFIWFYWFFWFFYFGLYFPNLNLNDWNFFIGVLSCYMITDHKHNHQFCVDFSFEVRKSLHYSKGIPVKFSSQFLLAKNPNKNIYWLGEYILYMTWLFSLQPAEILKY